MSGRSLAVNLSCPPTACIMLCHALSPRAHSYRCCSKQMVSRSPGGEWRMSMKNFTQVVENHEFIRRGIIHKGVKWRQSACGALRDRRRKRRRGDRRVKEEIVWREKSEVCLLLLPRTAAVNTSTAESLAVPRQTTHHFISPHHRWAADAWSTWRSPPAAPGASNVLPGRRDKTLESVPLYCTLLYSVFNH